MAIILVTENLLSNILEAKEEGDDQLYTLDTEKKLRIDTFKDTEADANEESK